LAKQTKDVAVEKKPTGLVLGKDLSERQWVEVGRELGLDARTSAFRIGDWLLHAEEQFDRGDDSKGRYLQAEELTGLGVRTLRNYASVCRRVPLSRRRDVLTFGHHDSVAALEPEEQERWLAAAEAESWSLALLREQVQTTEVVLEGIPRAVATYWTEQAKEADQPLWKWLHDQIECARQQMEQVATLAA
jgi:hypothetical protein